MYEYYTLLLEESQVPYFVGLFESLRECWTSLLEEIEEWGEPADEELMGVLEGWAAANLEGCFEYDGVEYGVWEEEED